MVEGINLKMKLSLELIWGRANNQICFLVMTKKIGTYQFWDYKELLDGKDFIVVKSYQLEGKNHGFPY